MISISVNLKTINFCCIRIEVRKDRNLNSQDRQKINNLIKINRQKDVEDKARKQYKCHTTTPQIKAKCSQLSKSTPRKMISLSNLSIRVKSNNLWEGTGKVYNAIFLQMMSSLLKIMRYLKAELTSECQIELINLA